MTFEQFLRRCLRNEASAQPVFTLTVTKLGLEAVTFNVQQFGTREPHTFQARGSEVRSLSSVDGFYWVRLGARELKVVEINEGRMFLPGVKEPYRFSEERNAWENRLAERLDITYLSGPLSSPPTPGVL